MPMNVINFKKEDFSKFADFMDDGFYRITVDRKFLECDPTVRKPLGILEDADLLTRPFPKLYTIPPETEMGIQMLKKRKVRIFYEREQI
jgi:hypothetical protein